MTAERKEKTVNILVLCPASYSLGYAAFVDGDADPIFAGRVGAAGGLDGDILREIGAGPPCDGPDFRPDAIALRSVFGGTEFTEASVADPDVVRRLSAIVPSAPIHLPRVLSLLEGCGVAFPAVPVVLVFETAFFTGLPPEEQSYAIDREALFGLGIRRYGFHGVFHEAAARLAGGCNETGFHPTHPRILSICLEPLPEVSAILGCRPVTVTSGATPLEGIPGNTTCGELDPSIIMTLAEKLRLGPEQINGILTRESGLSALSGGSTTVEEVLSSSRPEHQLAREVLQYRILLACGSGIAAMGGVDSVVFSGKYSAAGRTLEPWLRYRLQHVLAGEIAFGYLDASLERLVVDTAADTLSSIAMLTVG